MNPKSTITEVCDGYNHLWKKEEGFIHGDLISENRYIVSYWKETWNKPPRGIAAVQLAAAITAADIEKDISREDCYSKDTDSFVLSKPLPKEVI